MFRMGLAINIVITSVFLVVASTTTYNECEEFPIDVNTSDVRCCKKCSPGYGVAQRCTNETDTVCTKCADATFSPPSPHVEQCKPCRKCGKHATLVQPCNTTHDTTCLCNFNFFWSEELNKCKLCTLCPIASGARVRCNHSRNSVCEECTEGTFSDVLSPLSPCRACTVCKPGQFMLQNCSIEQDTICLDFKLGLTDAPRNVPQLYNVPNVDTDGFDVIPIYCAILGAVVVALLCYVAFKQYSRLKSKRHSKVHGPHAEIEYSKASTGGDSGVCVETDLQRRTYNQLTKIRDLPLAKRKSVMRMLVFKRQNGGNWRDLAMVLGYTREGVTHFEVDSFQDKNVQCLLQDWSTTDQATVGALINGLNSIARPDIIRVLLSDMENTQTNSSKLVHLV